MFPRGVGFVLFNMYHRFLLLGITKARPLGASLYPLTVQKGPESEPPHGRKRRPSEQKQTSNHIARHHLILPEGASHRSSLVTSTPRLAPGVITHHLRGCAPITLGRPADTHNPIMGIRWTSNQGRVESGTHCKKRILPKYPIARCTEQTSSSAGLSPIW